MNRGVVWAIETTARFDKEFSKLDRLMQKRVLAYLLAVADLADPRSRGKGLSGGRSGQWRYRVGDYRVIVEIEDARLVVLALTIAHRREVY